MEKISPSRRRLYLLRHGEVDYFDPGGRPFHPDTVPLNERGRAQARALAELLRPVRLDRAVTSGLLRTVQTAEAIVSGRGLKIECREALREIRTGRLSQLPPEDVEKAFLQAFPRRMDPAARFLGGETLGEFLSRVLPAYHALLEERDWQSLLLVAHGGVNRAILLDTLGAGMDGFGALEQDPGALNLIDLNPDSTGILRLVNHTPGAPIKEGLVLTTMERLYREYRGGGGEGV